MFYFYAINVTPEIYVVCHHRHCGCPPLFERLMLQLAVNVDLADLHRNRVVIRYSGSPKCLMIRYSGSPKCLIPAAHGNSLSNRPFIRTNPSVIDKMKEVVGVTGGHAGPAKMYKESVRSISSVDPRMCPRDIKQVGSLLAAFLVI